MDQAFSQQAALIARYTFNTPNEVVEILDSACQPDRAGERERKRHKTHKVEAAAEKLDECANWKPWAEVSGITVKGMRTSAQLS